MKAFLMIPIAAALAILSSLANAADIRAAQPVYKAPPADVTMPVSSWAGFYIGLNAGWVGSVSSPITNTGTDTGLGGLGSGLTAGVIPTSVDVGHNGFIGGGQIGYNWQASNFVYGLEADFDGASAKSNATIAFPGGRGIVPLSTAYNSELDWLGTVRVRAGFTIAPTLLFYATGGLAVAEVKLGNSFTCATCGPPASTEATTANALSRVATGWTVGAGAEWMFTQKLSLKAEYLYVDLGNSTSTIGYTYGRNSSSLTSTINDRENIVRGGINYHF